MDVFTECSTVAIRLSHDGNKAFSRLIECLSAVRDLQTTALADLGRFAELAAGEQDSGKDPLQALCTSIQAMHRALDVFCTAHAASETHACNAEVERQLSDINRHGQTLSVVATLTKTTAASYGTSAFVEYVDDLARIALVIRDASESVLSTLAELEDREGTSLASCRDGLALVSRLMQIVSARAEEISRLHTDERQAATAIAEAADALVQRSNQQMKVFVTAVQFSDRLAQRLDHLAQILNRDGQNVEALAAAHARSIAGDVTGVAEEVSTAMQALSEIWRKGAEIYSAGAIARSIEDSLDTRRETARFIVRQFAEIRDALNSTAKDADTLPGTIEAANQSFNRLESSTKSVAYSAMNSSLLASRSEEARHAMATLSFEVRATAAKCLAAVQGSQKELQTLAENSKFGVDDLISTGTALDQAITAYESEIELGQHRLDQLDQLRTQAADVTARLLELVQDAIQSMQEVLEVSDQLGDMAASLEDMPPAQAPDETVLAEIWDTYSMDDERAVHAALYPNAGQQITTPAEAEADSDDLDDVFF